MIAVIVAEDADDFEVALDDSTARNDDAFWARFVARIATPHRFLTWWVARRWLIPRDIRRR